MLQRFWELEDVSAAPRRLKPEDESCEKIFQETHRRDRRGRYVVKLPLTAELPLVATKMKRMALNYHSALHRRFARDSRLAQAYREFMKSYEELGHMSRVPRSETLCQEDWYLPHNAVVQQDNSRWKLRVVFDASRRTRDGHSLNSFLLTGPASQGDLSLILLNWRRYRVVFTADIVKMFRQIRVVPEHQDYQRIIWSPDASSEPVKFRLNTVTYGEACAPYLAIRTLSQLVQDEGTRFPLGARCLQTETYVDDIFAGADDIATAIRKRVDIVELLASAGIQLDKWAANYSELLPDAVRQVAEKSIENDQTVKTLGVRWVPEQDEFRFDAASIADMAAAHTKRSVLSNIARLFDPLGWLSPVTVVAKILMQDMWLLKLRRWLGSTVESSCQIHGFANVSARAYAAAVYLRIDEGHGRFRVSLLASKSKVVPVKTVSIPNLELCGAALLVKLILRLTSLDFLQRCPIFVWSDSQIVLTWLRTHPCHWKTFVANRVSLIQTQLPSATWSHVPTKENPADLASRGVLPEELAESSLWWRGPAWLSMSSVQWPHSNGFHVRHSLNESEILTRFSSLTKLLRFVAYCRRTILRVRNHPTVGTNSSPHFLTSVEISDARVMVIRLVQATAFAIEIGILTAGKRLPKGGRLASSYLTFDRNHPPILPQNSYLSRLFVRHAHHQCLHGGPILTSSYLMSQVWILSRNRLVKSAIRSCITCQRARPQLAHQLMGELPVDRVVGSRAFANSGLDYAGPVQVRMSKGRGNRSSKGYIALFVCFATRAIHLELVSDLTSESFIAAYRRFVGRRGICQTLYSDNATNFQGADKELRVMFNRASKFYQKVASLLANDGTNWKFIPPSAPHYGGLWEAGVKSVKHHLRRVIGEHTLTFEELSTVLVEIEACLNSRPLGPLSSDTDDLRALTPSHFLNEGVSTLIQDAELVKLPENRLGIFQLLQRIRNNFWKRWSGEYLAHLQCREKWRDPCENFKVGQLVLVRDDRYPPSKWPLGRVTEVHPGPDGLVGVVTVKTATSSRQRHIARLCPLRLADNPTQDTQ
ncbi:uncharacterized protein LOC122519065 [Polistes fuscatus]|uniref:uncharacterized protein LOC122519065 n=1 Tax=Polistes fuscatus TaxID=30207 RepID=UPI001CA95C87|nr:uncharacterized protein LOC122519065 [Polistes fuscatus]